MVIVRKLLIVTQSHGPTILALDNLLFLYSLFAR